MQQKGEQQLREKEHKPTLTLNTTPSKSLKNIREGITRQLGKILTPKSLFINSLQDSPLAEQLATSIDDSFNHFKKVIKANILIFNETPFKALHNIQKEISSQLEKVLILKSQFINGLNDSQLIEIAPQLYEAFNHFQTMINEFAVLNEDLENIIFALKLKASEASKGKIKPEVIHIEEKDLQDPALFILLDLKKLLYLFATDKKDLIESHKIIHLLSHFDDLIRVTGELKYYELELIKLLVEELGFRASRQAAENSANSISLDKIDLSQFSREFLKLIRESFLKACYPHQTNIASLLPSIDDDACSKLVVGKVTEGSYAEVFKVLKQKFFDKINGFDLSKLPASHVKSLKLVASAIQLLTAPVFTNFQRVARLISILKRESALLSEQSPTDETNFLNSKDKKQSIFSTFFNSNNGLPSTIPEVYDEVLSTLKMIMIDDRKNILTPLLKIEESITLGNNSEVIERESQSSPRNM
jgi:hypothetical protein